MALLLSHSPALPNKIISIKKAAPFINISLKIQSLASSKLQSLTSKTSKSKVQIPFSSSSFGDLTFDFDDDDEVLEDSPWEGAVVYRRDASASHVEYCSSLERLGLGKLSTGVSKSTASAMGIRLPPKRASLESESDVTPVLVSVDITRRKRRLKLDGIVRTVITLGCNRCGEAAAQGVFSNFSLLLSEDHIEGSDNEVDMGVVYGEDRHKTSTSSNITTEDDEEEVELDDRFYFPSEEKEIDISKPIRDLVHLEITLNALCDANCKGLCLKCGTNLNNRRCNCSKVDVQDGNNGPLKNLRKQMQQR